MATMVANCPQLHSCFVAVYWQQKGIWHVKTSASNPFALEVNVNGWGSAQSTLWVLRVSGCFVSMIGQDKNDWNCESRGNRFIQVYVENGC